MLLALILAVAGCSGGGEPAPAAVSPRASVSGSPSATAAPSSSRRPPGPTAAGAEAFVRRYWAASNADDVAGTLKRTIGLTANTCEICKLADNYRRELIRHNWRQTRPDVLVRSVQARNLQGNAAQVLEHLTSLPAPIVDRNGKLVRRLRARSAITDNVYLEFRRGRWTITDIRELP